MNDTENGRLREHAKRGQALLETALIVPFLAMIVLGLIEVGRFAHFSIALANSARAGADYATLNPKVMASPSLITAAALNDVTSISPQPSATATTFCQCYSGASSTCLTTDCSTSGDRVIKYARVTVSGTYTGLFTYPGLPHSITISKTATIQYPQW